MDTVEVRDREHGSSISVFTNSLGGVVVAASNMHSRVVFEPSAAQLRKLRDAVDAALREVA